MFRQKPINYLLILAFAILYAYLGYVVKRYETNLLLSAYFVAFVLYVYVAILKSNDNNVDFWFYAAILFRIVILFAVPNLSDDFYRFIWDGRLTASGHHPFAEIPDYYIKKDILIPGIDDALFSNLNSPQYFTIYPPFSQYIFWLAAKVSPDNIYGSLLFLKVIVLSSEIGSILLIRKLLARFALPPRRVLLYALNPLIILELTGNVHLEAIMIFFLLLAILLLYNEKEILSAVSLACAICVKIIPLIFLPLFLPRLGWRKAMWFYIGVAASCAALFIPLFDREIISGFSNSISYYFEKFEFNASIYYIVRWLGFRIFGFNVIQVAGPVLAVAGFLIILAISSFGRSPNPDSIKENGTQPDPVFFLQLMFIHLTYCLFTTTLHPWYISTLLAFSVFTSYRFPLLWTGVVFLTYAGYTVDGFQENLWLTFIEYGSVLGYLAYEFLWKRKYSSLQFSS